MVILGLILLIIGLVADISVLLDHRHHPADRRPDPEPGADRRHPADVLLADQPRDTHCPSSQSSALKRTTRGVAAVLPGVLAISLAGCGEQDDLRSGAPALAVPSPTSSSPVRRLRRRVLLGHYADDEHAIVVSGSTQRPLHVRPHRRRRLPPRPRRSRSSCAEGTGLEVLTMCTLSEGEVTAETAVVDGPQARSPSSRAPKAAPDRRRQATRSGPADSSRPRADHQHRLRRRQRARRAGSRSARQLALDEMHSLYSPAQADRDPRSARGPGSCAVTNRCSASSRGSTQHRS